LFLLLSSACTEPLARPALPDRLTLYVLSLFNAELTQYIHLHQSADPLKLSDISLTNIASQVGHCR